jgi:MraZ protein
VEQSGVKWEGMLIGEYRHTIDDKKRISMPASFRREIGKKMVITKGLDSCLFAYTLEGWKKVSAELDKLPMTQSASRSFNRFILGSAFEVELDAMGRVLVPDHLKDFADLKSRVVVVGLNNRLEIWDERKWKENIDKVEKQADVLAERLSEVGMF